MLKVNFYDDMDDEMLKFAVVISKFEGKWVLCKHKERNTYECPGGHREENETIQDTAKRELWEETGAVKFDLTPICVYAVERDGTESFGMLYFAEVYEFGELPNSEIEKIVLFDELPKDWTYPLIQPKLMEKVQEYFSAQ